MHNFQRVLLGSAAVVLASATLASADISLYASAPGIQTAEASGITGTILTETFDTVTTPVGPAPATFVATNGGNYTAAGTINIDANNQYGGFGQGNFLSIDGVGSTETISFATGINYFGFLWTAGDATNRLSFYDAGNVLIASYSTGDLLTFLPNDNTTTKTAVNGTTSYYTGNYYGQPTATGPNAIISPSANSTAGTAPTLNTSEPYAYLHFLSSDASIRTVVVEKTPGGGNFESDNHSVSSNAAVPPSASVVLVQSVIPEPSTFALIVLGFGAAWFYAGGREVRRARRA